LIFEGKVIIELRRAAPSLEAMLTAFENTGWVPCIPYPIAKGDAGNSSTSMHNAVNSLNSHQARQRIHFSASKRGITWQPVRARQQSREGSPARRLPDGRTVSRKKRPATRPRKRSATKRPK